jgi:hypothetical protein
MWPSGAGRRGSGEIPASRWPGSAGSGRGLVLGLLGTDLRARSGRGSGRRRGSTARPGGVRLELGSGELSAGAREWVAREALLGSREGAGGVGRHRARAGRRLYCGGAHGVVESTAACAGRAGGRLNSRGRFLAVASKQGRRLTQLYGA